MNKVKICVLTALSVGAFLSIDGQTMEERISTLEEKLQTMTDKEPTPGREDAERGLPEIHGILRGKYEYEPDLDASRFEVRNARLSAEGNLPLRSSYKLEVDLCDESAIKMKDAWVRVSPWSNLRITLGQQRMPFSIDAHRNPSAQYFANRSFIAKQVGDVRDVGVAVGYSPLRRTHTREEHSVLPDFPRGGELIIDAGIYNGSNLDNQKSAWFSSPAYSARAQFIYTSPRGGRVGAVPSVQHQLIAGREASYTSMDLGAYYESPLPTSPRRGVLHLEAEFLRKFYDHNAFSPCNAFNAMAIYRHSLKASPRGGLEGASVLLRYDYMDNHSDGKKGFAEGTTRLQQSDAQRHRLTAGLTFHVANKYFPTDIRLNYEKYWYPHGGAKESEQDKLVAELMIRF